MKKVINRENISHKTTIGYALQCLAEEALSEVSVEFRSNVKYFDLYIAPDLFIGEKPTHSIHVTCSQGDDSLTMKKWRYVAELCQLRSIFLGNCHAINLMFGSTVDLMDGDRKLLGGLFDSTVFVENINNGTKLHKEIYNLTEKGLGANEAVSSLLKSEWAKLSVKEIGRQLKGIIKKNQNSIWTTEICNELHQNHLDRSKKIDSINFPITGVSWKRSLLRLLCINEAFWGNLFQKNLESIRDEGMLKHLVLCKLVKYRPSLVNKYAFESEWIISVDNGLDLNVAKILKNRVLSDDRRKYEILDLWDNGERAKKSIDEFKRNYSAGKNSFNDYLVISLLHGGSLSVDHHRSHPFDILIILLGISQNGLQQRLGNIPFGVKDVIRNVVPRTDIAISALSHNPDLAEIIAKEIIKHLWVPIGHQLKQITSEQLCEEYIKYRIYCITKGSSINSLKEVIKAYFENNGFKLEDNSRITVKNDLMGKFTTDFEVVAIDSKGIYWLVKCLFGESGADHKAEEMQGRIKAFKLLTKDYKNSRAIFIADGYWKKKQVQGLYIAGWDYICSCNQLDHLLKSLN
jgi:hypothetical protein